MIVGVPGHGFRGDLRADDPVRQGSRTFIPVLTEQDYYRAEFQRIEAFAVLVPVERVWTEEPGGPIADRLQPLDAPPPRPAVCVTPGISLVGRRLVQAVPDGFVRDLRAISDAYTSHSGALCLRVCAESAWYAWGFDGSMPPATEVPTSTLWVE